ncbi:GntR family transcriptional regulator [Variovorax sp. efr-133-TYG-130]|uniref:GntR family transcriptional regulator n=1 Tax=Variovorax sp. efr-133-TYG-130 TaxID=3040327 RepID=UPI0025526EC1|nr:GntR family transcriptional regulator [Variovorax sp. efr-133-TYG-130]
MTTQEPVEVPTSAPSGREINTRGRLTEAAYDFLKEGLLEGRYAPGQRIALDSVADAIGASRQPVMDAMRRLSSEGFLSVVPQVGCLVVQPDKREIADFLRMLASIEGTCAELAAERATDAELELLQLKVKQFSDQMRDGLLLEEHAHAFRLHNRDFHHLLYSFAHSEMVSTFAASMSDRADFYIAAAIGTKPFGERFWEAVEEHRRIAEVLTWRDGPAVRRVIETHVLLFIDNLHS